MADDLTLKLRMTFDGKEVVGGVEISREQFRKLAIDARRAGDAISGGFSKASEGVRSISAMLSRVQNLMVGAFAAGSLKQAIDGFAQLQARIGLIEDSLQSARAAFAGVFAIAQKSGQEVGAIADVYSRIGRNARLLGLDQQGVLETTQAVANAVKLSGASAASAQAALVQFGQALASGALRGDELNSIMEQTPALAEAIARGMGKTVGELRRLGEEGKLTAQEVIGAIRNESARLEAEAARMGDTIGASLTRLGNAWQKFVGENTQGSARALASAINLVAENLDKVAATAAAAGAGLAAAFAASRFAAWTSAAGGLATALLRINPVTAGIGLAVTALGLAFQDWQRKGETAANGVRDALEKLRSSAARVSADIRAMSGEQVRRSVADIERQRDAEAKRIERMRAELESIQTRRTDSSGRVTGYDMDAIRRRDALQAEIAGAENALAGLNKELDGIRASMKQAGTRDIEAYFDKFGSSANEAKKKLEDLKIATDKALAAARARVAAGDADVSEIARIEENYRAKRAEILKSAQEKTPRLPRLVETFDAELAAMRAGLKTAEEVLEASFRARLVKEEDYWRAKGEMQRRALDLEAADLRRQMADQDRIIHRKGEPADNIERAKNKLGELKVKLDEIEGRRMVVDLEVKTNLDRVRQELEDLKAGLREKIAEATGGMTPEMRRAAIERSFRDTLAKMGEDAEGQALIRRAIDVEAAKAEMASLEGAWRLALETMRNAETSANIQREQGLITTAEAQAKIAEAHRQAASELDALLPKLEAVAATLGPEAVARVAALKNELSGIKKVVDPLAASLDTSIKNAFEDMFLSIGQGAKTAKDAFLDFARSVLGAIQRILAQRLAEQLFGSLGKGGSIGGAILSFFGLKFAAGGHVPGTGNRDTVPALLTPGEYVIRKDAVRRFGIGLLDAINGLRIPPAVVSGRLAFAAGGLVPAAAPQSQAAPQQNIRIVNAVDPELARDWIESPAGERVILNVLTRNAGAVRTIMGN